MVGEIKLNLSDLGPISNANINMGKITLVGGPNGCGKSTLSKFLYSFLKANSYGSDVIAKKSVINTATDEVKFIKRYIKNCNDEN